MPTDPRQGYRHILDTAHEAIYVVDPAADQIIDANPAACAMLHYRHDELLATPISRIHPAEMPQMTAFAQAALRDGESWTISMTCRTKNGIFLPTEMTLFALDTGHRVYVIGLVHDRSDHRGPAPTSQPQP
jgi:PAS domain S-box-containing protein